VVPLAAPIETSSSRKALGGFFLSGLLLAFPGAILPAWGHHIRPQFATIGNYFLMLNMGLVASVLLTRTLERHRETRFALVLAASIAFASLVSLSFTAPPVAEWWRLFGLFGLGLGAGTLNTGVLHAISAAYRVQPAATINLAGTFFGLGSLVLALLVAGVFNIYTVPSIVFFVALAPGLFAIAFARGHVQSDPVGRHRSMRDVTKEFTSPSAVLFSLLLFFQFGNEWAIAGWLPLFLILRIGLSPATSLLILAAYWLALVVGRLISQAILPRVHHGKFLLASVTASMFGCMILAFTDNLFGAAFGTLLVGFGFAPIYPLVVEKIGARFPHYHPGFFNGIFSLALTGGMLAPAILGYTSEFLGIQVVMALPFLGACVVFVLVLLIWLESKSSSPKL
jgi:MFS transporter, FHS family, glucose/mannose:H+ symporter